VAILKARSGLMRLECILKGQQKPSKMATALEIIMSDSAPNLAADWWFARKENNDGMQPLKSEVEPQI
jgi:hypothetical protein